MAEACPGRTVARPSQERPTTAAHLAGPSGALPAPDFRAARGSLTLSGEPAVTGVTDVPLPGPPRVALCVGYVPRARREPHNVGARRTRLTARLIIAENTSETRYWTVRNLQPAASRGARHVRRRRWPLFPLSSAQPAAELGVRQASPLSWAALPLEQQSAGSGAGCEAGVAAVVGRFSARAALSRQQSSARGGRRRGRGPLFSSSSGQPTAALGAREVRRRRWPPFPLSSSQPAAELGRKARKPPSLAAPHSEPTDADGPLREAACRDATPPAATRNQSQGRSQVAPRFGADSLTHDSAPVLR